jgi:D-3-phosphoglycerate dehydrogenase
MDDRTRRGPQRPTVLVTTRTFDAAAAAFLTGNGCIVRRSGLPDTVQDSALSQERVRDLLRGVSGWIVGVYPVTRELMEEFPRLEVISRRGVGYDTVDVQAARDLQRIVTIAAGGNEQSVADHTVGLMLGVACRICESDRRMRAGAWETLTTLELHGKTVGLVGLGRIARGVAKRVQGFDARVIAYDPSPEAADHAAANGIAMTDLEELLRQADIVSLHVPLMPGTRHLIDRQALLSMRRSAILINTARGGLVDDRALLDVLREGHLAGAGLDVFESEQAPTLAHVTQSLLSLQNFVGTPHVGGSSAEGMARANMIAAENTLAAIRKDPLPPHRVVVGR